MRSLRINFLLPNFVDHPVGGYRVVVDYANQLARRGHRCTLTIPLLGPWNELAPRPAAKQLYEPLRDAWRARAGLPWAPLEPGVRIKRVLAGVPGAMPDADVTIATAWHTAATVNDAPARCGAKLYFIQHYETAWAEHDPGVVDRSWQLPMHKGVIAKWLVEKAQELGEGERTSYVPNGLDLSHFRVKRPVDQRNRHRVGMLVHASTWKGTDIGLQALEAVRDRIPELEVTLYGGVTGLSGELPAWMTFAGKLVGEQVVDYFNDLAIFIHPSLTEGWPLPPAEAMACGAALVCADNQGVLDYAVDGQTAAVVPRGEAEPLAEAIIALIENPERRIELARNALEGIRTYSVEAATDRFEALLADLASRPR